MYLTFTIFAALCLITVFLESRVFHHLRIEQPAVFDYLGKPSAFFHGITGKSARFFLTFRYLRIEELKGAHRLFLSLSCAYILGYTVFGYMILEIIFAKI